MADTVEGVEVRIGADTTQAKSGMQETASSISGSLQQMTAALNKFSDTNRELAQRITAGNKNIERSFSSMQLSGVASLGQLTGAIDRIKSSFAILTGALAGGILWKESIGEMLKMEDAVRSLQITFGMTAAKAVTTALAMNILGKSGEDLSMMGMKVARQLKMNEQGIQDLGVTTRNATTGALLPLDQIMQNGFKTMQTYRAGADQDEFALAFFGRTVGEVVEIMLRLPAAQEAAIKLQKEMGVEFGSDRQQDIERYRINVGTFSTMLGIVAEQIGGKVMPSLMRLANYFNETGPSAAKKFLETLTNVLAGLDIFSTGVSEWVERMDTDNKKLLIDEATFKVAWNALIKDGWKAANAAWDAGMKERERVELEGTRNILGMEADMLKRMAKLAEDSGPGKREHISGYDVPSMDSSDSPLGAGPRKFPEKDTKEDTRLAEWKAQLEQMKEAEGYFHELSYADEAAFWEKKLALVKGNGAKEVALRREIAHEIYDANKSAAHEEYEDSMALYAELIAAADGNKDKQLALAADRVNFVRSTYKDEGKQVQDALKEEIKLREEWAKKEEAIIKDAAKFHIEVLKQEQAEQESYLSGEVAAGRISADQKIQIERQMEAQIHAEELKELDAYIATLQVGTLAYQQAQEKRLAITIEFNFKMLQLAQQEEKEREQYALQADQAIQSSLGTLIDNLVNRTKTLKQTWQDFVKQLTQDLNKIATDQLMKQLLGPGTQGGGILSGITSKIFGTGGASQAATEAANTTALTALTAALTANTAALTASSASGLGGLFGGGGGSSFGATQGGGIMSLFSGPGLGSLLSLDTGTNYVPQTSLALVHRGEAVIPARYNNQSGKSLTNHNHFYIAGGVDTRTQHQIAKATAYGVRKAQIRTNGS